MPETLTSSDNSLKVIIDGIELPYPTFKVEPCSNQKAIDEGLMAESSEIGNIVEPVYAIGSIPRVIQLT